MDRTGRHLRIISAESHPASRTAIWRTLDAHTKQREIKGSRKVSERTRVP
jgi:hypothetical protein